MKVYQMLKSQVKLFKKNAEKWKPLNRRINKSNNGENLVNKERGNYPHNGGGGQMLLIAGVLMVVMAVAISAISINLSNVGMQLSMEKTSSVLQEFRNVRKNFGLALDENINGENVQEGFKATKDGFFELEMRHGNFFDASLEKRLYTYDGDLEYLLVNLTLSSGDAHIKEEIEYPISSGGV